MRSSRKARRVATPESVLAAQAEAAKVRVSDEILELVVRLANATREHDGVVLGASPRVGVDLLHLGRALALGRGRDYVVPDDLKELFPHVVNHRLWRSSWRCPARR